MHGNDALAFLAALAALLGGARLLGELARAAGLPAVVGELATGLLLGASGLQRVWPDGHRWLFPGGAPAQMLSGYTTVAVVMLLVVAGLEVDLGMVKKRGRTALVLSLLGILLPFSAGVGLGHLVPPDIAGEHRNLFALFLGAALSISALPVTTGTRLDLGLFKSDVGLLVMTAAMLDDVIGWLCFSVLLGHGGAGGADIGALARTVLLAIGFAALCLVPGRRLFARILAALEHPAEAAPGRALSLVASLALLAAAITQAIGVHAALGGFVIGLALGDARQMKDRTRQTVHQVVANVFAPVLFASVTLGVDFGSSFRFGLAAAIFAIACFAKLLGCLVGARLTGLPMRQSLAVAFGLNARGAMEILLAFLAREARLIDDRVFVALVLMALATSLIAGPAMKYLLYPRDVRLDALAPDDAAGLVRDGGFVATLTATTSARAIEELGRALAEPLGELLEPALISVLERELVAATGLGDEVAIPHAAVEGLDRPVVALGLSPEGIDFDAPDGRPAKIVFLLLLPPKAYEQEVLVLAALARSVFDEEARRSLLATRSLEDAVRCLDEHAKRIAGSSRRPGSTRKSLADV